MSWIRNEEASKLYDSSIEKFEAGKTEEAIEDLDKAILLNPKHVGLFNARGICYAKLNRFKEALEDFDKVIELKPDAPWAYLDRGRTLVFSYDPDNPNHEDLKQAIEDLNKAVNGMPDNYEPWWFIGAAKMRCEGYTEYQAISDLSEAIELNPECSGALFERAGCFYKIRDFASSLEDYKAALKISEGSAESHLYCGACRVEVEKDYAGAIDDFTRAIQKRPDYGDAYAKRGHAYVNIERYRNAIKDFDEALKFPLSFPAQTLSARGIAKSKLNDLEGAIEDYSAAMELKPDEAWLYENRGSLFAQSRKPESAMADFDRAIELAPRTSRPYMMRGMLKNQLKDYIGAKKDLEKALSISPDSIDILNYLGKAYYYLRDFARSREVTLRILRIDPDCEWAKEALQLINTQEAKFKEK